MCHAHLPTDFNATCVIVIKVNSYIIYDIELSKNKMLYYNIAFALQIDYKSHKFIISFKFTSVNFT